MSGAHTAAPDSVTNEGFFSNILPPSVQWIKSVDLRITDVLVAYT